MDAKLDHLIEKIKRDGVEEAQQSADKLLQEAREKARKIVENAQKEAEAAREKAKTDAEKFQENGETALKHAAQNTRLLVKEQLGKLFDRVLLREVQTQLSPEFLTTIIAQIVNQWKPDGAFEISLSEKNASELNDMLLTRLKHQKDESITIKINPNLTGGFRLNKTEDALTYDFSDESITEALKIFLNPQLKKIMDASDG